MLPTEDGRRKMNATRVSIQIDASRFAESDQNGDMQLEWEEFLAMQPKHVRAANSLDEIKSWFKAADLNGNGTVSINEFFSWTLAKQIGGGGEGLQGLFAAYDKDGTGYLDANEFQKVADDLGFGAGAYEIFQDLDQDNSGAPPPHPSHPAHTQHTWAHATHPTACCRARCPRRARTPPLGHMECTSACSRVAVSRVARCMCACGRRVSQLP